MSLLEALYLHDFASAEALLCQWHLQTPDMGVLCLVPDAERACVGALQALARQRGFGLFGAIFPAVIGGGGFREKGLVLLRFAACPPHFITTGLSSDPDVAGCAIADATQAALGGYERADEQPCLFLVFDGMVPTIGSILVSVRRELKDAVRYAGANAGSESFRPMPCVFDGDRCVNDAVLGLFLPKAVHVVVSHDYPVTNFEMRATSTTGNRVDRIDGKPALMVYQDAIRQSFGVNVTPENFYDYAVHYPFGLISLVSVLVRIPVGFDADGAIHCIGEIPPGALLRVLQAPTEPTCRSPAVIGDALRDGEAADLITFYCAGRRLHFGAAAVSELEHLRQAVGAARQCGALSLGEIDTESRYGYPQFHNAALVCLR